VPAGATSMRPLSICHTSNTSALRRASLSSTKLLLPAVRLTVYLTVYDRLLSCYRVLAMAQKPDRNGLSLDSQGGANGFRGRVSQVRILPGPLPLSGATHAACVAFLCGKPSLYPLSYRSACRDPPDLSDGFDSLSEER
jgi:hypothetical protein